MSEVSPQAPRKSLPEKYRVDAAYVRAEITEIDAEGRVVGRSYTEFVPVFASSFDKSIREVLETGGLSKDAL